MSEAVISRQPGPAATRVDIVAVVAAGTIGVSWTALFLARGLAVRVYDPRPGVEEFVRAELAQIAPTLAALGLPAQDLTDRLEVADSLESAVAGADAVQESGPEDLAIKHRLLADMPGEATEPDAVSRAVAFYQVATGILSEGEIAPATRDVLRHQGNARVVLGDVVHLDLAARAVTSRMLDRELVSPTTA